LKKEVYFDERALEDFKKFPERVQDEFYAIIEILEEKGFLEEPSGKKLVGYENIYEMRVISNGVWRALYRYDEGKIIIIKTVFHKKSQKTPLSEIKKALRRK
jgi:phage-related protein